MTREIFNLFPLTVERTKLNITEQYRLEILSLMKDKNMKYFISGDNEPKIKQKSLSEASESKFVFTHQKLSLLKDKIKEAFNQYIYNNFYYTNDFIYTTSWYTRTKPGRWCDFHRHRNCMFSGVLYIEVGNGGTIDFRSSGEQSSFHLQPTYVNINNCKNITFNVKNLDLLFFPAECQHAIGINESKKDRYSIAFNFMPIGKIGIGDSTLLLK